MTRRSRRFVWIAAAMLLLAALAGAYSQYRSYVAEQLGLILNSWILARTAEGFRVDANIGPESGNLLTVTRQLSGVTIAAPGDLWTLQLPRLAISVDTFNPFAVAFNPEQQLEIRYTVAGEEHALTNAFREAQAGFSYGRNGQVTGAYVTQSSARLEGPVSLSYESFQAQATFDPQASASNGGKSVGLKLQLADAIFAQPVNLPLGDKIERIELDADVAGRLQPGRASESLAAWRDAGGVIQLRRLAANWGPLALTAEGTLALDGQMQPLFAGTATVRGYNETVDALAQAGLMELGQVTATKIALAAMSKPAEDGGPPAAKLPITIQGGFLFVGPLKLAQMPRIVWQ